MQKKIIALAVAAVASSAAFAQSNVTVYGVMDATFDYVGAAQSTAAAKIKDDQRVSSNSSYLGFKGVEDLGNGLKALFQVEGGLTSDSAGGWGGANRDTYVGLTGGFGTVLAGNLTAAARTIGAKVDVNAGATGIGYQGATYGRIGAVRTGVDDRTANAIAYVTPSFSGLNAIVAWGAGSEAKDAATRTDNVWSLGATYANGPIYVAYAYTQVDNVTAGKNTKAKSNRLGGTYKFGANQIGLMWDQTDADTSSSNNRRNAWLLNGKFGVTAAGSVIAGYSRAGDVDGTTNTGANHYFLGYEHNLSKRTTLKALYAAVKNESAVAYNFYNTATGEVAGLVAGQDPKGLQIGVRHSF